MRNCIVKFLEIQGYKIGPVEERKDCGLVVRVEKKKECKNKCPGCGSGRVSRHAKGKWRLKKHSHYQEKIIYLEAKRDRLICLKCRKVFSEELPDIKKYSRHSENFAKQSLKYLSKNSFNEVGTVNQIGYQSLKNSLYNYVDPFKLLHEKLKMLRRLKEIYIGLDGQSFRGKDMILTITEVRMKELLTILPSEHQRDLERFLEQIPLELRLRVKGVTMDMTNKHWKLLAKYFPNAKIVIDHYHVVSYAIMRMQKIRTTLQSARRIQIPVKQELDKNRENLTENEKKKLKRYFLLYPELQEAYLAKENVRSLYRMNKQKEVKEKFEKLTTKLMRSKEVEMRDLGKTLSNWQTEILNYFKCKITNAYTEGLHTKCKLIKRKSFGFRNVDTYIRKLILGLLPFAMLWGYTHFST